MSQMFRVATPKLVLVLSETVLVLVTEFNLSRANEYLPKIG